MSARFQIPHSDGCPTCGRPALPIEGALRCANKHCEDFREEVA